MFLIIEVYKVKDVPCWPLKFPNYATYDLKYAMIRSKLSEATVPLRKDV